MIYYLVKFQLYFQMNCWKDFDTSLQFPSKNIMQFCGIFTGLRGIFAECPRFRGMLGQHPISRVSRNREIPGWVLGTLCMGMRMLLCAVSVETNPWKLHSQDKVSVWY